MPPEDPQFERLEKLLAEALDILESEGSRGVEAFLLGHPEDAPEVRKALESLDRINLLEQVPGALPNHFGDFVLKGELGSGGMGVVYLAEQQSLGREVALKVIRPELLLFEGARERFRREIEAVARLEHPAIVPILATGTAGDIPYYAMPRLRGRDGESIVRVLSERNPRHLTGADLRMVIDGGSSDSATDMVFGGTYWQAVVRLIRQAAIGIEHAHLRGVLHRDIKPSNILFTVAGQAVVLDFGLARAGEDAHLTRTGAAAGSPAYMAPEQVRGERADERTDVYALAATMHCLLGLRPPFATDSSEALRSRILAGEKSDLSQRIDLPPELGVVIECALDLDREHRYPSAQAFADDLQAVLDGRAIAARKLPMRVRIRRFLHRHPTISSVTAVAGVFLMLLPALLLWQEHIASEALASQVAKTNDLNRDLEDANRELADQVLIARRSQTISLDAVSKLLAGLSTETLRHRTAAQRVAIEMLRNALTLFEQLPKDTHTAERLNALKLETMHRLCFAYQTTGNTARAEKTVNEALEAMQSLDLSGGTKLFEARFQLQKAALLTNRGASNEAPKLVHAARETISDLIARHVEVHHAWVSMSDALVMCGHMASTAKDLTLAEQEYRAAIAAADHTTTAERPPACWMTTRLELVRFCRKHRRYDEGIAAVDELMQAIQSKQVPEGPVWPPQALVGARALTEKHYLLKNSGHLIASKEPLAAAIVIYDELMRTHHDVPVLLKDRGAAKCNLAIILTDRREFEEAIPLVRSAIEDQVAALQLAPGMRMSVDFLTRHRMLLTIALRESSNWADLEPAALQLGRMRLEASWRESAARDLLLCAKQASADRRPQLIDQAFAWLQNACKGKHRLKLSHPAYEVVRTDERFKSLR